MGRLLDLTIIAVAGCGYISVPMAGGVVWTARPELDVKQCALGDVCVESIAMSKGFVTVCSMS